MIVMIESLVLLMFFFNYWPSSSFSSSSCLFYNDTPYMSLNPPPNLQVLFAMESLLDFTALDSVVPPPVS